MSATDYLDSLNYGTSAETDATLGTDRLDFREPPDEYHFSGLQISRMKNLLKGITEDSAGGTRVKLPTGTSNRFGAGEYGIQMHASRLEVVRNGGTAEQVAAATLSAKGDAIGFTGTGFARLAVGSNGQVLTADSTTTTGWKWSSAGSDATSVQGNPVTAGAPTNGQLLIGKTSDHSWNPATLGTGTGISITTGAGTLQVNNTGVTSLTGGGGVSVTGGTGAITLGSACGGDLSGSVDAATVTKIQGRAVSSSTPSSGQTLRYNGSAWAPWAPTLYTASQHIADYVARGGAAPSLSAGSYTTGCAFYFTTDATITGAQFYWPGGAGALTVKVSLWRDTTRLSIVNVSVNAAGVYTGTFGASTSVTGTDHNRRYMVTIWENSGTKNQAIPVASFGTPAPPQSFTGIPFLVTTGFIIERFYMDIAGDNPPTASSANNYYAGVDPLFTMP